MFILPANVYFFTSLAIGLVSWSLIAKWYFWPKVKALPFKDAVRPFLLLHTFRFVGLGFLIPGVIFGELPHVFSIPAAYGDFLSVILAFISLLFLNINEKLARIMIWLLTIQGIIDILSAWIGAPLSGIKAGSFGGVYAIPPLYVTAVFVTHFVILGLLLRKNANTGRH